MRILAHPDPTILERTLLHRLQQRRGRDSVARSLVLVPTARLAAHVERRLAASDVKGAWLGVEVLTLHRLARTVLEQDGESQPRIFTPSLREALVRQLLRERPGNRWASFAERRPGATGRIAAALDELREAAVAPADLSACASPASRDEALAELFESYVSRLAERRNFGWTDEAGLAGEAADRIVALAGRYDEGWVHGAYEWIAVHVRLLEALAEVVPLTVLAPIAPGRRVTGHAETFAETWLLGAGESIETLEATPEEGHRLDLASLYDERADATRTARGRLELRHTQGAAAEVELAVLAALRAVADGCPAEEIALVARTLEPFAAQLEAALDDRGVPWSSSLAVPLRRLPIVRDFLLLLEAVAGDFPRRTTARLLDSPRLRWTALEGVARAPSGDLAERWSRSARIVGGVEEWSGTLAAWAGACAGEDEDERASERRRERVEQAEAIGAVVRALRARVDTTVASWGGHADRLTAVLDELFDPGEVAPRREGLAALRALLDEMRTLESAVGQSGPVPFVAARAWIDDAAGRPTHASRRQELGALRVLDAMQSRGLTFDRVFLLGMNGGTFPRRPREDPVLGEGLRRALRERTGRPLVLAADGLAEDRLLLAMILGSSRRSVTVSWQRADEAGRARSSSPALRELRRLLPDSAKDAAAGPRATTVPSHPQQWLTFLTAEIGAVSGAEAVLLRALECSDRRQLVALGRRFPELDDGLRMIAATESFEIVDPRHDARLGAPRAFDRASVSALDQLGRCPLRFFFRHVLGVEEPEPEAVAHGLSPAELGTHVHDFLERLYVALRDEGRFADGDAGSLVARALAWVENERAGLFGEASARLSERLPALWEMTVEQWVVALRAFLETDLAGLAATGWQPEGFELPARAALDLGDGTSLLVRGRFDRRGSDGRVTTVGDYKTSGDLAARIVPLDMLRGTQLQVPLYRVMAGEGSKIELIGVGPAYAGLEQDQRRAEFAGFGEDDLERGFRETIRVLVELARTGAFPLHRERHCDGCPYRLACRHSHPPTEHRESLDPAGRRYASLRKKSRAAPFLAPSRGADG